MTYFLFSNPQPRRWFRAAKYRALALPWSLGVFRSYLIHIPSHASTSSPHHSSRSLPSSPLHYFSRIQHSSNSSSHPPSQPYVTTSFILLPYLPLLLFAVFFLGLLFPMIAFLFSNISTTTTTTVSSTPLSSTTSSTFSHSSSIFSSTASSQISSYKNLHDDFLIPYRLLHYLNKSHQSSLLNLLTSSSFSTLGSPQTPFQTRPRAIFAYIHECNPIACIRASATAIAYARTTGRHPVILFHPNAGKAFANNDIRYVPPEDALFVVLDTSDHPLSTKNGSEPFVTDWTEFSLLNVVPTKTKASSSDILSNRTISTATLHLPHASFDATYLPKIGNTAEVATLDSAAILDINVFVTLSDMAWSRYAPRTTQENIIVNRFQAKWNDTFHTLLLRSASLFGRNRETSDAQIADIVLHETFKIPKMLLAGMSPFARQLLLLKLIRKQRRGEQNPRALFVHAQYGLGNRVRALGSAMAFSRRTNRVLVLIWVPDQHLNCRFTDLFVANDEFVVSDGFKAGEAWPFRENLESDSTMNFTKWYNFMRVNGEQVHSSTELVEDDKKRHIYVSTCYVIQSSVTPFIIRATSSYWQVLKSLTPHIHVARLVDRFENYPLSAMIGIHIRGRSIKTDITGITANDYSLESSRTTDYWRNLTNVETFVEEMKRQTADQLFYVAADQKDVFSRLEKEFPTRVFYTPRKCDNRDKECLPFALADILLLSKCSSLRGSYWSSFSELSTRIGGSRFLLAGIDFGRPSESDP